MVDQAKDSYHTLQAGERGVATGTPESRKGQGYAPKARMAHKRGNGEGNLYQRAEDGLWVGRLMVGTKADGRPDRRTIYGKTRTEVQKKLAELRRRAEDGGAGDTRAERQTVGEFVRRWLATITPSVRTNTVHFYTKIVNLYVVPTLGRVRLQALKPDAVQRLYAALLARPLSPRTVHHVHVVLHSALERAVKWGYVSRNVCDVVAPPRVPTKEMHAPVPEEVRRLLDTAREGGDRLLALWSLAVYTGARKGELLGLQWSDWDPEHGTISIHRTLLSAALGMPTYGEPKTARSRRTVTLPASAQAALKEHRQRQLEERLKLGPDYANLDLIFATALGTPLLARNVTRSFKAALHLADLPETVRFHDLRHAAATLMLKAGVPLKVASERLGHSNIATTGNLYTQVVSELERDAAQKIELALAGER